MMRPARTLAGRSTVSSTTSGPLGRVVGGTGCGRGGVEDPPGGGGGGGGSDGLGAAETSPTLPVQNDVCFLAPAQVNEMCTWSVCLLAPVYGRHPDDAAYEPQILLFQITYWMPRRRAIAL